jgi:long-subunit fatty acid transport protein
LSFNTDIKEIYQPTANLKVGAEYEIPSANIRLRGGYAYLPSPYQGDPSSFAQKYITVGIGFIIENDFAIDIGYARGFKDSFRYNYDTTSKTTEKITTNNFMATVTYRF